MSQTIWIIGGLIAVVAAYLMRCKVEFLQPLCDALPEGENPLDSIIAEFNLKPTSPKGTSDYRSVTMDKEDPKIVSKRIQDQSDFSNPKTAAAVKQYMGGTTKVNTTPRPPQKYPCNTGLCASSGLHTAACKHCPGSKAAYASAQSLFTTARLSI